MTDSNPGTGPLTFRVTDLASRIRAMCPAGSPMADALDEIVGGLAQPLRVAVAGRAKAGKSTLVNALLRQRVATTDVGECTSLVTWYRFGVPERVEVVTKSGSVQRVRLQADGSLPETLGVSTEQIERLDVWLSNDSLRSLTLIDTPGLSSANDLLSGITREMLAIDDASRRAASKADALVFVLALGARSDDRDAIGRFRSLFGAIESSAVNALCVLNKADKIDARADAGPLSGAQDLAAEVAPMLRLSVANVVPTVALVAESIESGVFTERHSESLRALAQMDPDELALALLSVDRFRSASGPVSEQDRDALLQCLDLWGIEQAVGLVRAGTRSGTALAQELRRASGIQRVRDLLLRHFAQHADTLKAQWATAALDRLATPAMFTDPRDIAAQFGLRAELEDLMLDPMMHRIAEVAAFQTCSRDGIALPADLAVDVDRLLSAPDTAQRLGLAAGAPREQISVAALAGAGRWKTYTNDPRRSPDERRVADVFVRSFELTWAASQRDD